MTQVSPTERPTTVRPYVAGKRRDGERSTDRTDRTSGEVYCSVTVTDDAVAETALDSAAEATATTAETPIPQRAAWCGAVADGIRERADELADCLVRETGKPLATARAEVDHAADRFDYVGTEIRSLNGAYRTWTSPDRTEWNTLVRADPLGVVVCRPAARSPLASAALQLAPALAAGNSAVLVPDQSTPHVASLLTDIVAEGLPTGGVQFLPEPTRAATATLTAADAVDAVVRSGVDSDTATTGPPRVRMTLGGDTPAVVLPDADVDAAVAAITDGSLTHPGARHPAASTVVAHDAVADALLARLDARVAERTDGDDATAFAPLVDGERAARVDELVTDAVARGATLVRGGTVDGTSYEPTLLADVPADAKIHHEPSGPVVAVTAVEDADEAASLVASTDRSRDPSVFTDSHDRAMAFADALPGRSVRLDGAPTRGLGGGVVVGPVSGSTSYGLQETLQCLTRRKRIIQ